MHTPLVHWPLTSWFWDTACDTVTHISSFLKKSISKPVFHAQNRFLRNCINSVSVLIYHRMTDISSLKLYQCHIRLNKPGETLHIALFMGIYSFKWHQCHDRLYQLDESFQNTTKKWHSPWSCINAMADWISSTKLLTSHWVMDKIFLRLYLCHDRSHQPDKTSDHTEWWASISLGCMCAMTGHINPTKLRITLNDGHSFPELYVCHDSCSP
jgi:hypothetical protein